MRILTLSQLSLAGSSGIAEAKIPLWWADGGQMSNNNTTSGQYFLQDGGAITSSQGSSVKLFALSSSWSPLQKYAFEVTIGTGGSTTVCNVQLYDFTTSSLVPNAALSVSGGGGTILVRGSQITLTPSHQYGITYWMSGAGPAYVVDASLIIFP